MRFIPMLVKVAFTAFLVSASSSSSLPNNGTYTSPSAPTVSSSSTGSADLSSSTTNSSTIIFPTSKSSNETSSSSIKSSTSQAGGFTSSNSTGSHTGSESSSSSRSQTVTSSTGNRSSTGSQTGSSSSQTSVSSTTSESSTGSHTGGNGGNTISTACWQAQLQLSADVAEFNSELRQLSQTSFGSITTSQLDDLCSSTGALGSLDSDIEALESACTGSGSNKYYNSTYSQYTWLANNAYETYCTKDNSSNYCLVTFENDYSTIVSNIETYLASSSIPESLVDSFCQTCVGSLLSSVHNYRENFNSAVSKSLNISIPRWVQEIIDDPVQVYNFVCATDAIEGSCANDLLALAQQAIADSYTSSVVCSRCNVRAEQLLSTHINTSSYCSSTNSSNDTVIDTKPTNISLVLNFTNIEPGWAQLNLGDLHDALKNDTVRLFGCSLGDINVTWDGLVANATEVNVTNVIVNVIVNTHNSTIAGTIQTSVTASLNSSSFTFQYISASITTSSAVLEPTVAAAAYSLASSTLVETSSSTPSTASSATSFGSSMSGALFTSMLVVVAFLF